MVAVLAGILGGILSTFLPSAAARGNAAVVILVGAYALILALLLRALIMILRQRPLGTGLLPARRLPVTVLCWVCP